MNQKEKENVTYTRRALKHMHHQANKEANTH